MMVGLQMLGKQDGYENGALRMPFLRTHCDILAAAPPHAGHGKQSRGAVRLGQGQPGPEGLFAAGGASWGS